MEKAKVYFTDFRTAAYGDGLPAKLKKLMREQLGGYFQAELEKAFGPEGHSAELRIDEAFLKENQLVDRGWE